MLGLWVPWFFREFLKTYFFDKVLHVSKPYETSMLNLILGYGIEYGIPLGFGVACFFCALWLTGHPIKKFWRSGVKISLRDAAKKLFEIENKNKTLLAGMSLEWDGKPQTADDRIDHMANILIHSPVPLYAKTPPSDVFEELNELTRKRNISINRGRDLAESGIRGVLNTFTEPHLDRATFEEFLSKRG